MRSSSCSPHCTRGSGCRRCEAAALRRERSSSSPASWGPLLLVGSLAIRLGLGFDAPWYLLELVSLGYLKLTGVAITLAGVACAAQLATVATGRYAPYPDARQRPARGPLRQLIRGVVLAFRARRRVADDRRRAVGG